MADKFIIYELDDLLFDLPKRVHTMDLSIT